MIIFSKHKKLTQCPTLEFLNLFIETNNIEKLFILIFPRGREVMMKRMFQIWNNFEPIFKYINRKLYRDVNTCVGGVKKVGDEIIAENKKLKFNDDSTESDEERNTKKNLIDTLLDPKNNFSRKETIDEIATFIIAVSFFKKIF
jgi:hypothetical protein